MSLSDDMLPPVRGNIGQTMELMGYPDPYDERLLETFLQQWGTPNLPALVAAIREAPSVQRTSDGYIRYPRVPELRVFAAFAAGFTDVGHLLPLNDALVELLDSSLYEERWAAALALGYQQDERALPMLFTMLTEYLPPHLLYERPLVPDGRVNSWREYIPRILTRPWRRESFAPPLRHALDVLLALLADDASAFAGLTEVAQETLQATLRQFPATIVFALGRLGAYGSLAGLQVGVERLRLWEVHLIMGALHDQYPKLRIASWDERPQVRDEVDAILLREYNIPSEERATMLADYERAYLALDYPHFPSPWVDDWY